MMKAAPKPWMRRKPISSHMLPAAPQRAEEIKKMTMPASRYGLRPCASESLPMIGTMTVEPSRYEVAGQAKRSSPPRSPTAFGAATLQIVWSSAARNSASMTQSMISTLRRCGSNQPGGTSPMPGIPGGGPAVAPACPLGDVGGPEDITSPQDQGATARARPGAPPLRLAMRRHDRCHRAAAPRSCGRSSRSRRASERPAR